MKVLRPNLSFQPRLFASIAEELRPQMLAKSILSGLLTYVLEIIVLISFVALIFSGPLAPQLPYGLGLIIAGDAVLCLVVALLSSFPAAIAVEQDAPSAILAVVATGLLAALPSGTTPSQQFATIVLMLVGTAVFTGLFSIVLGKFKLGGLVRFLPYPVVGGFLAGTGWLLCVGGVGVMAGTHALTEMLFSPVLWHWLPGVILGGLMVLAVNRFKSPLVLPASFGVGLAFFYLIAALADSSLSSLARNGWLIGPFPAGSLWQFPLNPGLLSQVNWGVLANQIPALAPVPLISVIALLLNVSGLELEARRDIDPNRELLTAGLGNIAGGLMGGLVGYHALSLSTLNYRLGGGRRLAGVVTALLVALTGLVGASLFNLIPRMLLGALLLFVGLSLLYEWVYQAWSKFSRIDFLIIVLVLSVIALQGFMEGVALGLVLTIMIFVINYSRSGIVRYELSGANYHSRVTRSPADEAVLTAHRDSIHILKLQGFIFFGTAHGLSERIRARAARPEGAPVRYLILDLALVSGLDSTTLLSFGRIVQLTRENGIVLFLSGASSTIRRQFEQGGLAEEPGILEFCPDLDHAVELCERDILKAAHSPESQDKSLAEQWQSLSVSSASVERLLKRMRRRELARGECLIAQGDEPDDMYFIESGQLTAQLERPGEEPIRLQTNRAGRSVGEIGFYLGIKRTAAVVADEPSVVYGLSRSELAEIESTDPDVANALHRLVVQVLGERVAHLTQVVEALQR
ncbi:MAG: SulP family inorganic anion transporter [Rudaea sp.]